MLIESLVEQLGFKKTKKTEPKPAPEIVRPPRTPDDILDDPKYLMLKELVKRGFEPKGFLGNKKLASPSGNDLYVCATIPDGTAPAMWLEDKEWLPVLDLFAKFAQKINPSADLRFMITHHINDKIESRGVIHDYSSIILVAIILGEDGVYTKSDQRIALCPNGKITIENYSLGYLQ